MNDAQIDLNDARIDDLLRETLARLTADRHVPASTYRLQFHKGFTFRDATNIVPYLHALGITHCYASPYLKATPGSTHGYDVVDHAQLNPELGTRADFDAWTAAMTQVGIGHILDTVPNHMGIGSDDNALWNDLLEDGERAKHGLFFDVAWHDSPRAQLQGRVLLPTLGGIFGEVLERGELQVKFDADAGSFGVAYFDRLFPLSPDTYADVLQLNPARTEAALAADAPGRKSLDAILDAIRHLPADDRARRDAEKRTIKTRLATLHKADATVRAMIEENLRTLNGTPSDAHSFNALEALLARQNYRLAYWRTASDEINYRRFFDVTSLGALSMERPEVFEEAHALIFELIALGNLTGLRIDHSDGLWDPKAYFEQLQREYVVTRALSELMKSTPTVERPNLLARLRGRAPHVIRADARPLYLVAEKILAPGEPLPREWAIDGTSGYDVLNEINGLFVDPKGLATLDATYRSFIGPDVDADYHELAYQKKRETLANAFAGELNMLAHQLDRLGQKQRHSQDFTLDVLRDALAETIACFGVYRTYVTDGVAPSRRDVQMVDEAIGRAMKRAPAVEPSVFDFLRDAILVRGRLAGTLAPDAARFAQKFQQLTSPVTAKGLEDTAFYIYHRLNSLNEVGGEPARPGVSPESLHEYLAARQRDVPDAMSVLSTHDTKRAEDVRARLHVLSELPDEWTRQVGAWHAMNEAGDVHPNDAYLLYQTLLGAWPTDGKIDQTFIDRILAYMAKAMREAKVRTSWIAPDEKVEAAMVAFIKRILHAEPGRSFQESFAPFAARIARVGAVNSLAQTLIRLAAPGVPDTYQGTELWDLSLVDPDNRRPVDYDLRARMLVELEKADATKVAAEWQDGRVKLLVTARTLRFRRGHAELFAKGDYVPLTATGSRAASVFAFARVKGGQAAIVVVPRLVADAIDGKGKIEWGDTRLTLPDSIRAGKALRDVLTSREVTGDALSIGALLDGVPVALLSNV